MTKAQVIQLIEALYGLDYEDWEFIKNLGDTLLMSKAINQLVNDLKNILILKGGE